MKFEIELDSHKAVLNVTISGLSFAGTISTPEFGTGRTEGVTDGTHFHGQVWLDGYQASFEARVDGDAIRGTLKYGWFFTKDFQGKREV